MPTEENKHQEGETITDCKPKPRRNKKIPVGKQLTARQKRFSAFARKYSPYLAASWAVVQVIWGFIDGNWKETWFTVIFLIALFLIAGWACWWRSVKPLKATGIVVCAAAVLSFAGWEWRKRVPAEPIDPTIPGTPFTHATLTNVFPFGYGLMYWSDNQPPRYEEFKGTNGMIKWDIDWTNIVIERDVAAMRMTLTVPFRAEGRSISFSGSNYSNVKFNAMLKTGTMARSPFYIRNQPVLYVATLNDNQFKPIFAIGFRITTDDEPSARLR